MAVLGLALIAGTTACGSGGASSSSNGGVLTIALASPPVSLDPSRSGQGTTAIFQATAYQGLLHLEGSGINQSPSLAQSFNWIDDKNTKLRVVLRDGLKFSDGSVLDSAAVKVSAEHFATNGSPFASEGAKIESIETPDAATVIFTLKESNPTFPYQLAETSGLGMIINPKAIEGKADLGTTTAGAGPYELSAGETVSGSTYTFVPNSHYYDKAAIAYDKIVIKVIPDASTALAALQSGQVQISYATPDGAARADSAGIQTAEFPGVTNAMLFKDNGKIVPALGNADVRRAINYAIDRKAAAEVVTLGTGTPTAQLAGLDSFGYDANLQDSYPYDLEKAKHLMADAGYAEGFTLPILVPNFIPTSNNLSQVLADQLSKIGITVETEGVSTVGAYASESATEKYGATVYALALPQGIPSAVSLVFAPNAVANPGHLPFPSVLAGAQAASAVPIDESEAMWRDVNKTIVDEALEVPIFTQPYSYYYTDAVSGVADSPSMNPIYVKPNQS